MVVCYFKEIGNSSTVETRTPTYPDPIRPNIAKINTLQPTLMEWYRLTNPPEEKIVVKPELKS